MARRNSKATLEAAQQTADLAEARARLAKARAEGKAWRAISNSYKGGIPTRMDERWGIANQFRMGTTQERQQVADSRARALNAYKNNPVAKSLVDTETDNVIGDGLNYQPTTDSEEWNREAKDKYYEWLENASVRGADIHSGCELERLLWSRSRVAGDIGWILVARGSETRIQVVESQNIVTPDGKYQDPSIFDGIEYDEFGAPVNYYVLSTSEKNSRRDFTPVAARDFVFLPHMNETNQARGITCFNTIFDSLSNLDRYIDGVSLAAWMATVMGIVFKQKNAGKQLSNLPLLTNSQGDQQRAITFENGMVKYVGTDEDVVQVQAQQPMQYTVPFVEAQFRLIGLPFDMPLEVVMKNMSQCNFASARIGLLPFYRSCRIKAARFGTRWSRTIRFWLSREKQRQNGDPKKWVSEWPEKYWNHDLLVNAWDYTDPVSEAQSDLLQISMGTKSHKMVITERGRDAAQIQKDADEWQGSEVLSTMTRDPMPEQPAQPQATDNTTSAEPPASGNATY